MYEKNEFIQVINDFLRFNRRQQTLSEENMLSRIASLGVSDFEVMCLTAKIFQILFEPGLNKDVFSVKSLISDNNTFYQWYEAIAKEYENSTVESSSNVISLQAYARKRNVNSETSSDEIESSNLEFVSNTGAGFFLPDNLAIKIESLPDSKNHRKFLHSLMKVLEFPSHDEGILKQQLEQAFNILK